MNSPAKIDASALVVGQKARLVCQYLSEVFSHNRGEIEGTVTDIFCVSDGQYQIDIKNATYRFRWDSRKDGGYFTEAKAPR